MGTAALAAAVWAAGSVGVRAADEAPGKSVEKNRRVEVVRNMRGGGHLGVTLEDREEPGAVVKDVQPDTPAAKAGLAAAGWTVKDGLVAGLRVPPAE